MRIQIKSCRYLSSSLWKISYLFFQLLLCFNLNAQIILNEIMFDVEGSDYHDEFIEIVNISTIDTIDLSGWQLSDSVYYDNISDAGFGLKLLPQQYGVILDGSYFANSTSYSGVIPDSALILTISDNAFAKSGLSNTKPKTMFLYDNSGNIVQKYRYSTGNTPGYSDEKIMSNKDNSRNNWGNSIVLKGTPGFYNSISPVEKDIGFTEPGIDYHPSVNIKTEQDITTTLRLKNFGVSHFSDSVSIKLFLDWNADSIFNQTDISIYQGIEWIQLDSAQEQSIKIIWQAPVSGKFLLVAEIGSLTDQNKQNNISSKKIIILERNASLKISEIKFLTRENEVEWIELYNDSEQRVSLRDWAVADEKDTIWVDTLAFLYPGQYKLITTGSGLSEIYSLQDSLIISLSSFPNLNNDKDVIYLINPAGGWQEQVSYTIDWLEGEEWRNPSLERISFTADSRYVSNWGPSSDASGATPGKENTIHYSVNNSELMLHIEPNPFSPDGDGFEDHCVIAIHSPSATARAQVQIYDILGRKIRALEEASYQGSEFNVIWNGRDDKGQVVRMGIYLVYVRLVDDKNGILQEIKETVVVAGKL